MSQWDVDVFSQISMSMLKAKEIDAYATQMLVVLQESMCDRDGS